MKVNLIFYFSATDYSRENELWQSLALRISTNFTRMLRIHEHCRD